MTACCDYTQIVNLIRSRVWNYGSSYCGLSEFSQHSHSMKPIYNVQALGLRCVSQKNGHQLAGAFAVASLLYQVF